MKKILFIFIGFLIVFFLVKTTYAIDVQTKDDENAPHTFIENPQATPPGAGYNPDIPTTREGPGEKLSGASRWSYQDNYDNNNVKLEGSYKPFSNQYINLYDLDFNKRDIGPHGGYGTSSNKCGICHAAHRSEGIYVLLRTENADDACSYCHIGDHRHSVVSAYWRSSGNILASNGHTIGSGKVIPDSTVWQWIETKKLVSISLNEPGYQIVHIRRYLSQRNKLMRWAYLDNGYTRTGPTYLRCQTCHQPHNAIKLIWRPYKSDGTIWSSGYKLLRLSPSGGIKIENNAINANSTLKISWQSFPRAKSRLKFTAYSSNSKGDFRIKAVDSHYNGQDFIKGVFVKNKPKKGIGDPNQTGYTRFIYPGMKYEAPNSLNQTGSPRVEEASMSFWCADCHNLDIAGKEEVESNWGGGYSGQTMLSDRSHVSPYLQVLSPREMGVQCYTCHNNDMARIAENGVYGNYNGLGVSITINGIRCAGCHISPAVYRMYKEDYYRDFYGVTGGNSISDFPHAGSDNGYKLLNDVSTLYKTEAAKPDNWDFHTPFRPANGDGMDKVCGICHLAKGHKIGVDK